MQTKTVRKRIKKLPLGSLRVHFPFDTGGYALDLSDGFSAGAYLLKQVATPHEAVGRSKALLAQSEFATLFVVNSVARPESG